MSSLTSSALVLCDGLLLRVAEWTSAEWIKSWNKFSRERNIVPLGIIDQYPHYNFHKQILFPIVNTLIYHITYADWKVSIETVQATDKVEYICHVFFPYFHWMFIAHSKCILVSHWNTWGTEKNYIKWCVSGHCSTVTVVINEVKPGPWFNIKTSSYRYRKSHFGDKTVVRLSYLHNDIFLLNQGPGPWFNIKMTSYQYRKYHCGDKTILRPSYLHNGISYTGKLYIESGPRSPIDNKPALSQVMAWCLRGEKPLPNHCWPSSLTHIWGTRGRWVKES